MTDYLPNYDDPLFCDPWDDDDEMRVYVPAPETPARPPEKCFLLETQQRIATYLRMKANQGKAYSTDWQGHGLPPAYWYCFEGEQYKAYRSYEDFADDQKLRQINPHFTVCRK